MPISSLFDSPAQRRGTPRLLVGGVLRATALASLLALLGACNNIGSMDFPGVYKIAIPQGNIITQEMIDQLRPGMTKRQVIFVMGTPLVRDPYHQDRWDYVYNFQPGGGERGQERISVLFEDDQLVSFSGDFEPTPTETPATTAQAATTASDERSE